MFQPDVCIFHTNCLDGMGAAYAVWRKYGDSVKYVPMNYSDTFDWGLIAEPEQYICLVDFSLPRDVLLQIHEAHHTLLVIDHHATAKTALTGVPFETVFDMDRSGAALTWEYFHKESPPRLINYIEDRDLWRFELPDSREASMYLWSYQTPSFLTWSDLQETFAGPGFDTKVIPQGEAILRYANKQVDIMAQRFTMRRIGGRDMPVVNATCLFSEVGDWLCQQGYDAAAYWFQRDTVFQWGLRSRGDVDVSAIAQQYGGGGHKQAAGFVLSAVDHFCLLEG